MPSASLSPRIQIERVIAGARVALAASGLFAIWMDPAEPVRFTGLTYSLHGAYLVYSVALLAFVWSGLKGSRYPLLTHAVDIVLFAVFQYLTFGPSSPFFVYYIFSLFCGAMRWGWRGTLATAGIVVVAYLGMAASMSRTIGPLEFELNRFIIRVVYLAVSAALLVYLGRHEERLRGEIERLARWPSAGGTDMHAVLVGHLEHAADIVDAGRAAVVWEQDEEPAVSLAVWPDTGHGITQYAPEEILPIVAPHLASVAFVSSNDPQNAGLVLSDASGTRTDSRPPGLHPAVAMRIPGRGLASAPFRTGRVSGRVFFSSISFPTFEMLPLTEVVARELGASLDQLLLTRHLQDIAASEERIRVARDLHDGVLQSLTGIRLEIRALAGLGSAGDLRDRLFALERALAIEQRELRLFIEELGPHDRPVATPLAARLREIGDRIALQWKAPVAINVSLAPNAIPEAIEQAVPLMVHEAIVNALKHGQPSRVTATVEGTAADLRIVVTDDGRGFGFRGRRDHVALLEHKEGPRSLIERVTALGGELAVDCSDQGTRVEMLLRL